MNKYFLYLCNCISTLWFTWN